MSAPYRDAPPSPGAQLLLDVETALKALPAEQFDALEREFLTVAPASPGGTPERGKGAPGQPQALRAMGVVLYAALHDKMGQLLELLDRFRAPRPPT